MGKSGIIIPYRRARGAAWLAVLLAVQALGCTAITWRGDDGALRHAGLVVCREQTSELGSRISRYALGLDLKLDGWWPGYSLGLSGRTALQPAMVVYETAESLGPSVAHLLEHGRLREGRTHDLRPGGWSIGYCHDPASALAVSVDTWVLGAQIALRPAVTDVTLGWRSTRDLTPLALQRDVVLVGLDSNEHGPGAVLWLPGGDPAAARSSPKDTVGGPQS